MAELGWNTAPAVLNSDDVQIAFDAAGDMDLSRSDDRIDRIGDEVQESLVEEAGHAFDLVRLAHVELDSDAISEAVGQNREYGIDALSQADVLDVALVQP